MSIPFAQLASPEGRMAHAEDLMASIDSHRAVLDAIANGALPMRKAGAEVGSPTQGQTISSSAFSALIPQDLAPFYYSTIATRAKRIALLTTLKRENAKQIVKERTVKKRHGSPLLISSVSESGIPGVSTSDLEKRISNIRFHAVQRQITHVGQQVNILGAQYPLVRVDGPRGLQFEQEGAIEGLAEAMERDYWNGDNSVDSTRVDGVFKQIEDGGTVGVNYFDLRGDTLDIDTIMGGLADVTADEHEGEPGVLFVDAEQWKPLSSEAMDKNRLDPARANPSRPGGLYWNSALKQLLLVGPNGKELEIREARLMNGKFPVPTATVGSPYSAALTASNGEASSNDASSNFVAADAGTYTYKVVPRFKKGNALPFTTAGIAVIAGDIATFEIDDDTVKANAITAENDLVDYAVWRSEVDGTSNYQFLGFFGVNSDGAGVDTNITKITDTNARIPGTFRSAALHLEDGAICDDVLMDTAQITLAQVERRLPFLACRYSAPAVVMPKKQLMFDNCGVA